MIQVVIAYAKINSITLPNEVNFQTDVLMMFDVCGYTISGAGCTNWRNNRPRFSGWHSSSQRCRYFHLLCNSLYHS